MPGPRIRDSLTGMMKRSGMLAVCVAMAGACHASGAAPVPASGPAAPARDHRHAPVPAQPGGGHTAADHDVLAEPPPGARLGTDVVPVAYDLELTIDPDRPRYTGRVIIDVDIKAPVATIWLHGEALAIRSAALHRKADTRGADTRGADTIVLDKPRMTAAGLLGFDLPEVVSPGRAAIEIEYSAEFGTKVGVFRQVEGGRAYVYTDFEPIDARRAFPCFDEPRFKTPWTVSLIVPRAMRGLSNMPAVPATPGDAAASQKRIRFATTPPLPSYLVAFAVGPFEVVDARAPGQAGAPVPMRIIVPQGKRAWADIAARTAPALLAVVADYFATPVPFPKIDLIAVPVFSGAMENPGLITVGSHILLSDPARPSITQQRFLALVCAHEFAHLWFGDLVTPEDWDDLWLNEGFATWLADKALYAWNAARMPHVDQVVSKLDAMATDEHIEARAVRRVGRARNEVESTFDVLSYKKAGAILAMFEAWLSEKRFRRAALRYVADHAGGTVNTKALMRALSAVTGRDLDAAFRGFLDQPGVPEIDAELDCTGRPRIRLSQRRYVLLSDRERVTNELQSTLWHVPVCVRYGTGTGANTKAGGRACTLLSERRGSVDLDMDQCPAWVVPNANASGYFRYRMPAAQLLRLARAPLDEREATELVHNLRALLYAGHVELPAALSMIEHISQRAGRHTHEAIFALLGEVGDHLVAEKQRAGFAAYVRKLYSKRARAIGFAGKPGESEEIVLLRPALIEFAGKHGADARLRAMATRLARMWLGTGRGIERGMIEATLSVAAYQGGKELYDQVEAALRRAIKARDEDSQEILFAVLGKFRQAELVARSLELVTDSSMGKRRHHALLALLEQPETRERALRFLEDRQHVLARSWPSAYLLLAPLFGPESCGESDLTRARALAGQVESARDLVSEHLADVDKRMRACARMRDAYADSAKAFFR